MAGKKKKNSAKNLFKTSKDKLIKETVQSVYDEDAKSQKSPIRQALKGNSKKALKKTVQAFKSEEAKGTKTAYQNVLTGSPKKALKGLVNELLAEKEDSAQKALNKTYQRERDRLRRRVAYFREKGFEFSDTVIPPKLEGNATQEDVEYLRAIHGSVLKRMAVSFTPPVDEAEEIAEEIEEIAEPQDFSDIDETVGQSTGEFIDAVVSSTTSTADEIEAQEETSQERYYRENPERVHDEKQTFEEGRLILQNIYDDINRQDEILNDRLYGGIGNSGVVYADPDEIRDINDSKHYAAEVLEEMLDDAIERMGEETVCRILEENASEIKAAVDTILFDVYVSKGHGFDDMEQRQNHALLVINNILNSDSPADLMEQAFGEADR